MSYTKLGDTGLEVSRLCLGCMNFGEPTNEADSIDIIDRALDAGINFIDTANVYNDGYSEEIVGEALQGRRDEVVLATKVFGGMDDRPNGQGLSRKHILEQAEASLDRLGTDYIDLYQIHRWDETTPIEETLSALDWLVQEGKVRYVGASTMAGWQFMKALKTSDELGLERFVCMQPEYSLIRRHEEANLLPVCEDQDTGVIPWSPLGGGFLTGKYERDGAPDDARWADDSPADRWSDDEWDVLDVVRDLAEEKGATPTEVALAWTLHKDVVTAPIIGPRTMEHLESNLNALDVDLSEAEIERLEAPIDPSWAP
ncbi:aldo/keto reductase [Halosimplex amylolyticum]|uniref:aldo/keto reductase n=1 Tax=Halosimplex amylolyticum TaxID=3396616 RepID=UPI003F56EDE7